ncbi:hypothetical protein MMC30_009355 [Trapelia coarctata]|nr:hypothetical protein [Trapelia coarctata]
MGLMKALQLPFSVLLVLLDVASAAIIGAVVRPRGWSYKRHVAYSFMRSAAREDLLSLFNPPFETTLDVYRAHMQKHKSEPRVVVLDAGAGGGWIGPANSKEVLLYFHGGGYVDIAYPIHIDILGELVATAQGEGKDFSAFVVSYGLAPKAQYPVQLTQAAVALKYLIETVGCEPQNIFVGGDSAGGNLAVALLSHLSHPHPSAPKVDLRGRKLRGAYLISPWVTFAWDASSMRTNERKDYLGQTSLKDCTLKFLGDAKVDAYNVPLSASPDWWKGLPVHDLCVLVGEYEMFLDDILAFAQNLKVSHLC